MLITQHHVSFSTPAHSVGHSTVSLSGTKRGSATPTNPLSGGGNRKGNGLTVPVEKRNTISATLASPGSVSTCPSGVGLHNVDIIAASMNELSSRVSQVMEIVSTLSQFRKLVGNLRGLPRVSGLWPKESELTATDVGLLEDTNEGVAPIAGSVRTSDYVEHVFGPKEYPLPPLNEQEEEGKAEKMIEVCS